MLRDWLKHNPPYQGWNWTSALEAGLRLIQFAWIDALLSAAEARSPNARLRSALDELRRQILPAHVWFAWRHRSFGSSANNHLLGELTGVIVALARWPELQAWAVPLARLYPLWEKQVLAQFGEDGGNREQALNYQLFSWEFAWQARAAFASAGLPISPQADERLRQAAQFFVDMQVPTDPWDYGDSDSAFVTPVFAQEEQGATEWYDWFCRPESASAIDFWWGQARRECAWAIRDPRPTTSDWSWRQPSGQAVRRDGPWTLRWDLSPLGYLATSAHGHLDALHLSLWLRGVALVIDPGTGVYYFDPKLRAWLAGRAAHNGPADPWSSTCVQRLGPFLWSGAHALPRFLSDPTKSATAEWAWLTSQNEPYQARRTLVALAGQKGWQVVDEVTVAQQSVAFAVLWQFPPARILKPSANVVFA